MSGLKVCRHMVDMSNEGCEPQISRSVCRNLFGPIDHEQLNNDLQTELSRIVEEKSLKYNFDFAKFTPLFGKFAWQRINDTRTVTMTTTQTDVPTSTICNTDSDTTATTTTTTTGLPASISVSANHIAISNAALEPCTRTPERTPQRRSTPITDYLRRKKSSVSRQIKFNISANNRQPPKRVRTSKSDRRGPTKQLVLEEFLPKLRPRHPNKKTC